MKIRANGSKALQTAIINLRGVSAKLNKVYCIHHANVQETYNYECFWNFLVLS